MTDEYSAELEEEKNLPEDDEAEFLDPIMEPFNPADIEIIVESKSLYSLVARMEHDEIDMNTDFQRHADLWDNKKMSRLIESILIRLPLPAFYFDISDDDKWLIVDGLQRLSAIRKFMIDKTLRLRGLEFLVELNGKKYDQIHRNYQRRLNECQITAYMIKAGTPEDVKYSVFRRINTAGLTLNNQEIRNALIPGKDRRFLTKLASDPDFITMMGDQSKRMKDQELVLRFWAFYRFDYLDEGNKKEMASFLDKAMKDLSHIKQVDRPEVVEIFGEASCRCLTLLGKNGFKKNKKLHFRNASLYEVWMVSLAELSEDNYEVLKSDRKNFRREAKGLISDPEFFKSITYSTHKVEHVKTRYQMVEDLIKDFISNA